LLNGSGDPENETFFPCKHLLQGSLSKDTIIQHNEEIMRTSSAEPTSTTTIPPIPQEAFDWYDEYAHGVIDRRTFIGRLSTLATGALTLPIMLNALLPNYSLAEQVSFNDPDIKATYVEFPSPLGHEKGRGYLVVPTAAESKTPTVLVVHENRGLNPYIKDVARRLAKSGFIAIAPDALHPLGGYPGNDDEGRSMQRTLDKAKIEQDFIAAAKFIKAHEMGNGKLGAVGFCFGGYVVNMLAATIPDTINAGVPYYGTPAVKEIRKNIKAPLLIQLAELDQRVNASWPEYELDLKSIQANYKMHMYPKTNHGYHNDSTSRYDEENAELAWKRTLAFFEKHLS
jgi:carboxymethylenebutenolidase